MDVASVGERVFVTKVYKFSRQQRRDDGGVCGMALPLLVHHDLLLRQVIHDLHQP
jgi:hypothetical protein